MKTYKSMSDEYRIIEKTVRTLFKFEDALIRVNNIVSLDNHSIKMKKFITKIL